MNASTSNNRISTRLFGILDGSEREDHVGRIFSISMTSLICLNVAAVMLETVQSLAIAWRNFFKAFEVFSVIIFTVEYLLRMWACTADPRYRHPVFGRIRYSFTFLALVDLFAILPFYLPMLIRVDLRFLRALRLLRMARLLKIGRYSESVQILGKVASKRRAEIVITVFLLLILMIMAAFGMYAIENEAQPKAFPNVFAAMWWAMATLSTVGYGDITPITPAGKVLAGIVAMLGVGMFALPAGILSAGFAEELQERKKAEKEEAKRTCPHCGRPI